MSVCLYVCVCNHCFVLAQQYSSRCVSDKSRKDALLWQTIVFLGQLRVIQMLQLRSGQHFQWQHHVIFLARRQGGTHNEPHLQLQLQPYAGRRIRIVTADQYRTLACAVLPPRPLVTRACRLPSPILRLCPFEPSHEDWALGWIGPQIR